MKRIIVGGLLVVGLVTAVTTTVAPSLQAQAVTEAQCALAKQRLETQLVKVKAAQTAQTSVYIDGSDTVTEVTTSAGAAGYDTAALIKAGTSVTAKITAFTTKADAYAVALEATQKASCADGASAFVTSLTAARTSIKEARDASAAVRTAFTGEAIPAIKDYAASLKTQPATEETAQ